LDFESAGESASRVEARKCGNQVKKILNEVIGLRSEAGTIGVEDAQVVQNAELALTQLEGRLSLRGENVAMSPVLMSTRTVGATAPTGSGVFWEAAVDDLPYGQIQEEERLMTSSSDLNVLPSVNCVSGRGYGPQCNVRGGSTANVFRTVLGRVACFVTAQFRECAQRYRSSCQGGGNASSE
jgi:hypothetical protein